MAEPTTYEKHTTHTDALDTLGTIIGPDAKRDAIHLAVYPAVNGTRRLVPGAHVALDVDGVAYMTARAGCVGIVDPFLTVDVHPGERFWLVVYPRQITSLRHVWEHPAFDARLRAAVDDAQLRSIEARNPGIDMDEVRRIRAEPTGASKDASERWLRAFCAESDCPGFDAVVAVVRDGSWTPDGEDRDWASGRWFDERLHFSGVDAHGSIPPEFWDHMGIYLGQIFGPDERAEHFSCSC